MEVIKKEEPEKTIWFYRNEKNKKILHRDNDLPAVITKKGSLLYYKHGRLHREGDKPAIIHSPGRCYYFKNGLLHRDTGPAVIEEDGSQEYHVKGRRHRVGGPAVIKADGSFEYRENGLLHRDDGPCYYNSSAKKDEIQFEWRLRGKRHRMEAPAVIYGDKSGKWFLFDMLHRYDGAADKNQYYLHGILLKEEDFLYITAGRDKLSVSLYMYAKYLKCFSHRVELESIGRSIKRAIYDLGGGKMAGTLKMISLLSR